MWLIPSLRRPNSLHRFFQAYTDTKSFTPVSVLVDRADFDDNAPAYRALILPAGCQILVCPVVTMGEKVQWWLYQNPYKEIGGNGDGWVGLLGDDNVPITPLWDRTCVSKLRGYNFVSTDDGWQAPNRAAGATLWSRKLIEEVGYIFPPGMKHLYVDNVWEDIGRAAGNWDILMDVLVEHRHVDRRPGSEDATHKAAYSETRWTEDRAAFMRWKDAPATDPDGMRAAVEKVRALKHRVTGA